MIVIAVEGVLADVDPDGGYLLASTAKESGRFLYDAFRPHDRLILLSTDTHIERARGWLAKEQFRRYSELHCMPLDWAATVNDWKLRKLRELRIGSSFRFYVDSDAEIVRTAIQAGIPALMPVLPAVFPGKNDAQYRPWYDLVEEIDRQDTIRAAREMQLEG